MALVNCADCNQEISSRADSCIKCGAPLAVAKEAIAAGATLNTIQETSKKFKLQSLISMAMIVIGVALLFSTTDEPGDTSISIGGVIMSIGLFWNIINRIRIWWHHK